VSFIDKIKNWISPEETPTVVEAQVDLASLKLVELRAVAKERGMKGYTKYKKAELLQILKGE
jgi:hypothetical protein